jgi:hypothetical protein
MRDVLNWWKSCKSRLWALFLVALIFAWMSLGLWQSERALRMVVREVRQSTVNQETTRQRQFAQLLEKVQEHLGRQDQDMITRHGEHLGLQRKLEELLRRVEKPTR